MDILGSIGKIYTFLLLVILFLGSGLAVWAGINALMNKKENIKENADKLKNRINVQLDKIFNNKITGGNIMKNNGFVKLAVFSFIGIIISAAILTVLPKNSNTMSMNSQYGMTAMSTQGMYGQSNMQGSMSGSSDLSSIQQQLNNIQQQINQLQNNQMGNSMNSMQSNASTSMNNNMNNSNMNNSSMNNSNINNSSSGSSSGSSSMSSMPMM